MSNFVISLIRTWVPVGVAAVAVWLVQTLGVEIDTEAVTGTVIVVLTGVYYWVVRALESRFPWVGWFLGVPKEPTY